MSDSAGPVRWTIKVSRETDLALRAHLGQRGMKKGDLSRFVEMAVRGQILEQTVEKIRTDNDDLSPDQIDALLDQAVNEVRTARRTSG